MDNFKYYSSKSMTINVILKTVGTGILLTVFLILFMIFTSPTNTSEKLFLGVHIVFLIYLTYIIFSSNRYTYYTITSEHITYRSGPFKGSIPIKSINHIEHSKYPGSGFRPALGVNGLSIFYSNGNKVYISPELQKEFLDELLSIKNTILVK